MTITHTWVEKNSRLHTSSATHAQAWRNHGLEVIELTDPSAVSAALHDEKIVWV